MNRQISGASGRWRPAALLCAALAGMAGGAEGDQQSSNLGIQFNLSTPGARSLAMGGAFIGLADDATAAYTNPAGLTNLTVGGPEVAVELRSWRYSNLSITGGHVNGPPTNVGIDTVPGISSAEVTSEETGLSFLSVGYVLSRGSTLALYRHQVAEFQAATSDSGVFVGNLVQGCAVGTECYRFFPALASDRVSIANNGLSFAHEIPLGWTRAAGDSLSLGAGLFYYQLEYDSHRQLFDYFLPTWSSLDRRSRWFFGPADYLEDNVLVESVMSDSDAATGGSLGLLWKDGDGRWSLGAVYRKGGRFSVEESRRQRGVSGRLEPLPARKLSVTLPDSYGVGMSYGAARGKTRVTLDASRVLYSQRFDDRVSKDDPERRSFRLADAGEVHLGFEQVVLAKGARFAATVRLGGWTETAHNLEYRGTDPTLKELYPRGEREIHWTAGVGLVFGENFQIDAAADLSDPVDTVSISLVKFL